MIRNTPHISSKLTACITLLLGVLANCLTPGATGAPYAHFEGRQTHPIGLTPDGRHLLALNTPWARLSVFDVSNPANTQPVLVAEIPVGLEPVSLAVRSNDEVWVVNELSDSVSVVSLSRRTVLVNLPCVDEPADVVFAGGKAFVSCARNALIRVFDAETKVSLGTISLAGVSPRALAVDAAGERVFAAFQLSGNGTTILSSALAPAPPAPLNPELPPAPQTGLIVPVSDPRISYQVLDHDVAEINASNLLVERYFSGVGTVLFNLASRPGTAEVWAANTEALNLRRFEPELRGHFADNRVTRLNLESGSATPFDLNPATDYHLLPNPQAKETALAQPADLVFSADGKTIWVAAFGSDRVAAMDAGDMSVKLRVDLRSAVVGRLGEGSRAMRGPRGLALKESIGRLYVLNKLANTISTVGTVTGEVLAEVAVGSFDPTPKEVKEGRGFLFDARLSGNGTMSCATCHVDSDRDGAGMGFG